MERISLKRISQRKKILAEVYFLLDPTRPHNFTKTISGESFPFNFDPYYCGVGRIGLNRPHAHFHATSLETDNIDKTTKIRLLIKQKYNPRDYVIRKTYELGRAIELEIEAIKIFGRKDKKTGILLNHSNGGEWNQIKQYSPYLEKRHNDKTIVICNKLNNRESLDKIDIRWIRCQIEILRGTRRGICPKSSVVIAKKLNQPQLFSTINREQVQIEIVKKVFDYRDLNNGRIPSYHSSDRNESQLGDWVVRQTRIFNGAGDLGNRYDSILKLEKQRGYKDTFIMKSPGNTQYGEELVKKIWQDLQNGNKVKKVAEKNKISLDLVYRVKRKESPYGNIINKYEQSQKETKNANMPERLPINEAH